MTKKELAILGADYLELNSNVKLGQIEIEEREQNLIKYWNK